jgi:hypothetical protein
MVPRCRYRLPPILAAQAEDYLQGERHFFQLVFPGPSLEMRLGVLEPLCSAVLIDRTANASDISVGVMPSALLWLPAL